MTLTYTLTENDYLQHQLFLASKSAAVKRNRTKTWVIISICFSVLIGIYINETKAGFTPLIPILGLAFIFLYPFYQRWKYKWHYQKHIAEQYKHRFEKPINLLLTEEHIISNNDKDELKLSLTGITNITETGDHFYLGLQTGGNVIIPKRNLETLENVRQELKQLSQRLVIPFTQELNWRWK